jgi:AcrR family transcriptional regulator
MSTPRGRPPSPRRHHRGQGPRPPIWAREAPPGRGRPGTALSRDQIAEAALAVADAEGLEAVSIRRIARELRSGAMSLYHYFDSRDELLDLMADRVASEMLVPELPGDWRPALKAIAMHSRATFKRHPWLNSALQERPRLTPNLLRHIEQTSQAVASLAEQGVEPKLLTAISMAVDDYTIGFTVREELTRDPQMRATGIIEGLNQPHLRELLESGEFPLLSLFLSSGMEIDLGDRFEQGLDWLLDGFEAQLGR